MGGGVGLQWEGLIMAMEEFSRHQQGIIKRFYDNRETIALQKLGDLVTDLYLAEPKDLPKLWKQAEQSLRALKVPEDRIKHVLIQKSAELLAELVRQH